MDEVSVDIDAPPEVLYELIADVTQMGRWSPECERCEWLGDATGPKVGARFKGWNAARFGPMPARWTTVSTVRRADPGRAFSFDTGLSGTRWTYRFEAVDGGGTRVTETRDEMSMPAAGKLLYRLLGTRRDQLRAGMRQTLERLKEAAEATADGETAPTS